MRRNLAFLRFFSFFFLRCVFSLSHSVQLRDLLLLVCRLVCVLFLRYWFLPWRNFAFLNFFFFFNLISYCLQFGSPHTQMWTFFICATLLQWARAKAHILMRSSMGIDDEKKIMSIWLFWRCERNFYCRQKWENYANESCIDIIAQRIQRFSPVKKFNEKPREINFFFVFVLEGRRSQGNVAYCEREKSWKHNYNNFI